MAAMGIFSIRRRSGLAAGIAAAMAASALGSARVSAAAADVEAVAVIWNAPAGCPTAQAIHDEVEKTLGGSLKQIAPVAAAVSVLEGAGGRWRASLVVHSHGKRAERQFEAESCQALAAATGVIIALAAEGGDDGAPARPAAEVRPPAPERLAAPMIAPTIAPTISSGPTKPASGWSRSGVFLQLGGLLDGGTMPSTPASGLEVAAGESWAGSLWRLRLIAGASYFLPQAPSSSPLAFGIPAGQYWMLSFSGRGCMTAALSRFEIGPCLGAEVVAMHGSSIGGTSAESTQYWPAPTGSFVAALTFAPSAVVFARVDVAFPGTRRTFLSDESNGIHDEIFRVSAHAVRGALGVELRFF
jgi:hypothetical protein